MECTASKSTVDLIQTAFECTPLVMKFIITCVVLGITELTQVCIEFSGIAARVRIVAFV